MRGVSDDRRDGRYRREYQPEKEHRLGEAHERRRNEIGERPYETDATERPRNQRCADDRCDGGDDQAGDERPSPAVDA